MTRVEECVWIFVYADEMWLRETDGLHFVEVEDTRLRTDHAGGAERLVQPPRF